MRDAEKDLALCEAATPGPWESLPDAVMASNIVLRWVCQMYDSVDVFPSAAADARFIAEARTALPHWIHRAIEAKADVERLRKQHHGDRVELNRRIMKLETANKQLVEALQTLQAGSADDGARECAGSVLKELELRI